MFWEPPKSQVLLVNRFANQIKSGLNTLVIHIDYRQKISSFQSFDPCVLLPRSNQIHFVDSTVKSLTSRQLCRKTTVHIFRQRRCRVRCNRTLDRRFRRWTFFHLSHFDCDPRHFVLRILSPFLANSSIASD